MCCAAMALPCSRPRPARSSSANSLGGSVAYIRHPDGSFLYYAHLSAFRDGWEGHQVEPGDVIGFCGASGDATVPHVHFGIYDRSGIAHDPMASLVDWLHRAERRAGVEVPSQPTAVTVPADPTELGILWSAASRVQPIVAPATTAWAPVRGLDTHGVLDGLASALALLLPVGALVTLRRRRPGGRGPIGDNDS